MKLLRNLTFGLIVLFSVASTALCGDMGGPTILPPPPPSAPVVSTTAVVVGVLLQILAR